MEDKPKATNCSLPMIINQTFNSCSVIVTLSLYPKKWTHLHLASWALIRVRALIPVNTVQTIFIWDFEFVSKVMENILIHLFKKGHKNNTSNKLWILHRKWTPRTLRQECVEIAGQKMDFTGSKTRMRWECGSENGLLEPRTLRQECVENVGQKMDYV